MRCTLASTPEAILTHLIVLACETLVAETGEVCAQANRTFDVMDHVLCEYDAIEHVEPYEARRTRICHQRVQKQIEINGRVEVKATF